jgi:putative membrane protein
MAVPFIVGTSTCRKIRAALNLSNKSRKNLTNYDGHHYFTRNQFTLDSGELMRRSTALAAIGVALVSTFAATQRVSARSAHAPAAALDDPTIVAIFDAANTADIETGALGAERGSSKEVRDFGTMLVRDHSAVRQQGRDLAKKLGVTPTPPKDDQSARDHAAAMKHLRGLTGTDFDHAFLQHEVAFHKAVIDAVTTTLLPAIQNAEVKALVVKVAPAFQAHMAAAQNLDNKISTR